MIPRYTLLQRRDRCLATCMGSRGLFDCVACPWSTFNQVGACIKVVMVVLFLVTLSRAHIDTTRFTSDTIAISKLLADRHPTTLKDGALVGIIPLQTKIDPETGRPLNDAHDVRMVMRLRVIDGDELKMAVGKDMEFCANECLLSVTVMQALQVDVYSWFK